MCAAVAAPLMLEKVSVQFSDAPAVLVSVTAAVKAPRALATSPVGAGRSSAEFIAAAIRIIIAWVRALTLPATTSAKMAGTTNRASFFTKNPLERGSLPLTRRLRTDGFFGFD